MINSTKQKPPRYEIQRRIALLLITLFTLLSVACSTTTTTRNALTRQDFEIYEKAMSRYNEDNNEGFRFFVSKRVRLKLIPPELYPQYGILYYPYEALSYEDEENPYRIIRPNEDKDPRKDNTIIIDREKNRVINLTKKTPGRRQKPFDTTEVNGKRMVLKVAFDKTADKGPLPIDFIMQPRGDPDDKFYFVELPTIRDSPLINKFILYNNEVYELLKPCGPFYQWKKPFPIGEEPFLEYRLIRENEKISRTMKGIE